MIAVLINMLGARRTQAITVWLLSTLATAAAVAGPVALGAVDRAILRHELDSASATEMTLSISALVDPSDLEAATQFGTIGSLAALRGFEAVRSGELEAFGPVADGVRAEGSATSRVVFRDRICDHVTIVSGRCLAGVRAVPSSGVMTAHVAVGASRLRIESVEALDRVA
jgi:hypothetical protein